MKKIVFFLIVAFCFATNVYAQQWNQILNDSATVYCVNSYNSTLLFGTTGQMYITPDGGNIWQTTVPYVTTRSILINGSTIYAGTGGIGILKSNDGGDNWFYINTQPPIEIVFAMVIRMRWQY